MSGRWHVERSRGSAAAFHARAMPEPVERAVWVLEVDRPALVLGSTQPATDVRAAAVEEAGIEVVRRRSGGGAVLLEPGGWLWIDVLLPAGDPLWDDDVGRSFLWLGQAWATALAEVGTAGAEVHHGGFCTTRWSRTVCFAGLGSGEVTHDGRKVVGISQRRTRAGARFQCAAALGTPPESIAALLEVGEPGDDVAADLAGAARALDLPAHALADAFLRALDAAGDPAAGGSPGP